MGVVTLVVVVVLVFVVVSIVDLAPPRSGLGRVSGRTVERLKREQEQGDG